jgi:hypothetical protein
MENIKIILIVRLLMHTGSQALAAIMVFAFTKTSV